MGDKVVDVNLHIGDEFEVKASVDVSVDVLNEDRFNSYVEMMKGVTVIGDDDLFVKLSFCTEEGVDAFKLGGLVGKFKALVSLIRTFDSTLVKFFTVKMEPKEDDPSIRDMVLYIVIPGVSLLDETLDTFYNLGIDNFNVSFEASERLPQGDDNVPLMSYQGDSDELPLNVRLNASGLLHPVIVGRQLFDLPYFCLNRIFLRLKFEDFSELGLPGLDIRGWNSIRSALLTFCIVEVGHFIFNDEPQGVLFRDLYSSLAQFLQGIPCVEICMGNKYIIKARTQGLDFFNGFLPLYEKLYEFNESMRANPSKRKYYIFGSSNSGVSTIQYKIMGEKVPLFHEDVSINVESFNYKGNTISTWDMTTSNQSITETYLEDVDVIIWVIDSTNQQDIFDARNSVQLIPCNIPVLIYANKQDLPNAKSADEIRSELEHLSSTHPLLIQPSCGLTGDGLQEGLNWSMNLFPPRK